MSKKYKYRLLTTEEIKTLVDKIIENGLDYGEFNDYEDHLLYIPLGEYIREGGNYDEEVDSDYIHCHYTANILGETYSVTGSSYRKDMSICDEELSSEIFITEEIILSDEEIKQDILKKIASYQKSIDKLKRKLELYE